MQVFAIAPAATKVLWLIPALLVLILVPVFAVIGMSLVGARTARFEVSAAGLQLRGDWYGRFIPAEQLAAAGARRVDFAATPDLLPRRRTFGTGMPGYQSGWFRLRNGEYALLYLTDRRRAIYVPTTAGFSLLVSPVDPDAFLAALRQMGDAP